MDRVRSSAKGIQAATRVGGVCATVCLFPFLVTRRDPEAFAGLVQQFGPMALGVCRRVLGPSADVDDAFQAVFLSLARQADSFRDPRALPAWLHRVAQRVSHKALSGRESASAPPEAVPDPADPYADVAWRDVRRVLDEELDRLPEKYRGPVVLCWLDGLAQDEAAGKLGVSLATLKRRLEAGRQLMRSRLLRRGVAPVLAAAAVLDATVLRAVVPESLKLQVVELGVPGAAVRPEVEALRVAVSATAAARGYLKVVLALVLVGGVAMAGAVGVSAFRHKAPPQPPEQSTEDTVVTVRLDGPEEPLPPGAVARFGTTRFRMPLGEGQFVEDARISRNGRYLALSTTSLTSVYDVADWRVVRTWAHDRGSRISLSPSGQHLAASTRVAREKVEDVVQVLDVRTGAVIKEFPAPDQFSFTEDGRLFVWYSAARRLTWFDPIAETETTETTADIRNCGLLTPDGRFTLRPCWRGSATGPLTVFDVRTGAELKRFPEIGTTRWDFDAYAPNGETAAFIYERGYRRFKLQLWDTRTWTAREIDMPQLLTWQVGESCAWFSRDSRVVAVRVQTGSVLRWDVATGRQLPALEIEGWGKKNWEAFEDARPLSFLSLPDNRTVLTPCKNGWVRIWDGATGKETPVPDRYGRILASDVSGDGRYAMMAANQGRIDVRDAATTQLVRTFHEFELGRAQIRSMKSSSDGSLLAVEEEKVDRRWVRVWRAADGRQLGPPSEFSRHRARPIGFDASNQKVLIEEFNLAGAFTLFRCPIGTDDLNPYPGIKPHVHPRNRSGYAVSPDGRVVIARDGETKRFVRLEEGKPRRFMAAEPNEYFAWSPGGKTLLAYFSDAPRWRLCDAATGEVIRPIEYAFQPDPYVSNYAVSPGGRLIFAACRSPECRPQLIDTVAGKVVAELPSLSQLYSSTTGWFTQDGKFLITFDGNFGYRWDVDKLITAQQRQ
jgi:RNA polymerase sigma factor (sigma-70 family)